MDQNTILTALQKALAGGSGTLDDLDALLDRAKADIVKAKEEAAAKAEADRKAKELDKAKRAQRIADLANRLLEDKLTDDDVAMVFESYLKSNGMDVKVTAESVREGVKNSAELDQAMKDRELHLAEVKKNHEEWMNGGGATTAKAAPTPASKPKNRTYDF